MAQYPSAAGTDANLFVAVNNLSTSLTDNPLSSGATTVNVASTTGFPTAGYITIDAEAISYTGVTATSFTTCTRGADGTTAASHVTASTVFHDVVAAHHNTLKDEMKAVETDLVGVFSALNDGSSPASTATTILARINQIVSQIKLMTGGANWYTAPVKTMLQLLPLSGGTMSGVIAMGANKITGIANGTASTDAAAFGQIYYGFQAPVQATTTSGSSTTSSTFQNTALTASITPTSASHRIKVTVTFSGSADSNSTNAYFTIKRDSTNLGGTNGFVAIIGSATGVTTLGAGVSMTYIDSPATTSGTAYTVQIASSNNSSPVEFMPAGSQKSVIILEEIV